MGVAKPSRRSPRIRTWFETHFSSQRQEGEGILADISYTGARVEDSELRPKIGAQVILYVSLPEQDKPFQLEGKVARQTARGFAVEYERPGPEVRRGVDRVAELVGELDNLAPDLASDAIDADELELPLESAVTQPRNVPIEHAALRSKREEVSVERLEHEPAAPGSKLDASPRPAMPKEAAPKDAGKRETAPMTRADAVDLSAMSLKELEALHQRLGLEIGARREEAKQRVRREIEQLAQREGFSVEELIEPSQR